MNYNIESKGNRFLVIEKETSKVIKTFEKKDEARNMLRKLNMGSGFDSWTPDFFFIPPIIV